MDGPQNKRSKSKKYLLFSCEIGRPNKFLFQTIRGVRLLLEIPIINDL
jgi:hypothetical protein